MRFVETPIFTQAIGGLLDHERYRSLQLALILRPEAGRVIRGSGGLRKIRWSAGDSERDDLTAQQLRVLSRLVREEFG